MHTRARYRSGFTFLEIMVVIVLLGIMIAVVLPNMSGPRQKMAIQSTARDIASAGLLARQRAIVQTSETYLVFFPEEEGGGWQMVVSQIDDRERRRLGRNALPYEREDDELSVEERERELPKMVSYGIIRNDTEELDKTVEEDMFITFYPNGSCSGLAIQFLNERGDKMVVDFDRSTGRPSAYEGQPKSFAKKLREMGLNPADYGYSDDGFDDPFDKGSEAGAGFYTSAGWNEEERVDYYKDAVERMLEKGRMRSAVAREGQGAYYREANRWGN